MKRIDVVAAVIQHNNKILVVQRGENKYTYIAYKYEFPGGKVELGETEEQALHREIREELDMTITINKKLIIVNHQYEDFHITMHTFLCSTETTHLHLSEHIDHKWLQPDELGGQDWAAADLPIVRLLQNFK